MATGKPRSLRAQQLEVTRERVLDATLALLARGADTSLRAIALEAGIAERTLYRHFATRDELVLAITPRLRERTSEPLPDVWAELPAYAARLFARFDANSELVVGLMSPALVRGELRHTRSRNLDQLRALVERSFPGAPPGERDAAAATLRTMISGSGWAFLRVSCGLPNETVIAHAQWAIATISAHLRATQRRSPARAPERPKRRSGSS